MHLFQNSIFEGIFNSNNSVHTPPKIEKMPQPVKSKDNLYSPFSFFSKRTNSTTREIPNAPVLKNERRNSKDLPYYPHSGMGLFFV